MSDSCRGCPSYWDDKEEIARRLGVDLGAPMCKKYGHVLGKPGLSEGGQLRVAEAFFKRCPTPDASPPDKPFGGAIPQMGVGQPDSSPNGPLLNAPDPQQQLASCSGCKNFVPQEVVYEELGWNLNMCAAKAKLIPNNNLTKESKDCRWAEHGGQRKDTDWFTLRTEYEEGFSWSDNPGIMVPEVEVDLTGDFIEPTDYPSDKDVTPQDESEGIRAWRAIKNPYNGEQVTYLPIFRTDFFDADDQAQIPKTGSQEHPEFFVDYAGLTYRAAVNIVQLQRTPILWGPAGVGKTEFARYLAWMMNVPFIRISLNKASEVEDLAGKPWVEESNGASIMTWQDGRVPKAWVRVCVFMLDEMNLTQDEVWQWVRPLTDNSKQLVLDQGKAETRDRNKWCFPLMSGNPAWDPRNIGAQELSDADGDRVSHLEVNIPPDHVERSILRKVCEIDGWKIPDETLNTIMNIAVDLREMAKGDGELGVSWGLRPQIAVVRLSRWFPLVECYHEAKLNLLEPQTRELAMGAITDHLK